MRDALPHFYVKITLKFVISARKFVTLMWTENDASQMTYFSVSITNLFFLCNRDSPIAGVQSSIND